MKGTEGEMKDSQPLSEKGLTKDGHTGHRHPSTPGFLGGTAIRLFLVQLAASSSQMPQAFWG